MQFKKRYIFSVSFAFIVIILFYFVLFDHMSESLLLDSVLLWYLPLTFGLYGMAAQRINKKIKPTSEGAMEHLMEREDQGLILLVMIIAFLGGLIGILLFFIPITAINFKAKHYDMKVAVVGVLIWLFILWIFIYGIFPSL